MRKILSLLVIVIFILCIGVSGYADQTITAKKVSAAPIINGKADDSGLCANLS